MRVNHILRDRRYRIAREYCGYATRRHVARFCGDWLGQATTRQGALTIASAHAARRACLMTGDQA